MDNPISYENICNVQGIQLVNKMKCYNVVNKWPKNKDQPSQRKLKQVF